MARLRKEIIARNFPVLPEKVAKRLVGTAQPFDDAHARELATDVWIEMLRKFLDEKYGEDKKARQNSLERMLKNKDRLSPAKLKAIQTVLKEET